MQIRAGQNKSLLMKHSLSKLKTECIIGQEYPIEISLPDGEKISGRARFENNIFGPNNPGFGLITTDKPITYDYIDYYGDKSVMDNDAAIEIIWLGLTEGDESYKLFDCGLSYKLNVH